jgi:hypothetical protein
MLGQRVSLVDDPSATGTVVRYNVGDYLVFLDEPDGDDDTVWRREDQLEEIDW